MGCRRGLLRLPARLAMCPGLTGVQARTWMQAATSTANDMDCPATTGSRCVSRVLAMPRRATSPRLEAYLRYARRGGRQQVGSVSPGHGVRETIVDPGFEAVDRAHCRGRACCWWLPVAHGRHALQGMQPASIPLSAVILCACNLTELPA